MTTRKVRIERIAVIVLCGMLAITAVTAAKTQTMDAVLDAVVAREAELAGRLEAFHPLLETYIQTLKPDPNLGTVPIKDDYFLGRLDYSSPTGKLSGVDSDPSGERLLDLFKDFYGSKFNPDGFARMLVLDPGMFDRNHYDFEFVRREFVGEIRALVFEVTPKMKGRPGSFIGRIWVEDENYSIVRYNGIYSSAASGSLHFDSWRLNLEADLWYPAYIYTEESLFKRSGRLKLKHKGQTRIWGYRLQMRDAGEEFAKIMIDSPMANDRSETPGHVSPVESLRAWEREAEENVLQRLEKGGLLAPSGQVDQILETVVSNLEVTNSLQIVPAVRCRVLLTTPLESFTIGHTIVLSRGLIDVLPDEASLAMVLAHELGHIILGHQLDTKYAFSDQMLVGNKQAMDEFFFKRDEKEEGDADEKAMMLLASSPYSDKTANAGLFLKALELRASTLPALIRSHFGNRLVNKKQLYRMTRIIESAPDLYPAAMNQTAALPLGGRVKVDPWTAEIELMTDNQVVLLSAREKLPFEVTPLMPHLVRLQQAPATESVTESPNPAAVVSLWHPDQE
jgi:hypothetical protein